MKEAAYYERLDDFLAQCNLCSHRCKIADGRFGLCKVRGNSGGILYTYSYGNTVAANIDPVEKKPLYHFLPGSKTFSVACPGCNFKCGFCQNWEISQRENPTDNSFLEDEFSPQDVVGEALRNGCQSVSYTYTEPTVFFEYAYDTAKIARKSGLRNVFVTNGYISEEPLRKVSSYLDAVNVDLKFFKEASYKKFCGASLSEVLRSIRLFKVLNIWVEVTTLVIPGINDSMGELKEIADFISGIDINIPWHVSRFYPAYKFVDYSATLEETLKKAQGIGKQSGLKFVYAGNVYGWGNDTICPVCNKPLIKRDGFKIKEYNITGDSCNYCRASIPGVFTLDK